MEMGMYYLIVSIKRVAAGGDGERGNETEIN